MGKVKAVLGVLLVGIALMVGTAFAQSYSLFKLRAVTTLDDQKACAKDGGKGAQMFSLLPNGDRADEGMFVCILPVK